MICDSFSKNCAKIWHGEVIVNENVNVAQDTYKLSFVSHELAKRLCPGQFVMIRLANIDDPLLGRPLAVYRSSVENSLIEVVYLVIGKMTERLAALPVGTSLQVWGPLGNGFNLPEADHLVMVAGGIGQTPFYTLAEQQLGLRTFAINQTSNTYTVGDNDFRTKKVSLLFGARTQSRLACLQEFRELGVDVHVATDDGSTGHHGLITDLIPNIVEKTYFAQNSHHHQTVIVSCGPLMMLKAVYNEAVRLGNLPCFVSLESPMACGLGICYSCVVEYRDNEGIIDYVRTCVDGPVFDAYRLQW